MDSRCDLLSNYAGGTEKRMVSIVHQLAVTLIDPTDHSISPTLIKIASSNVVVPNVP